MNWVGFFGSEVVFDMATTDFHDLVESGAELLDVVNVNLRELIPRSHIARPQSGCWKVKSPPDMARISGMNAASNSGHSGSS